MRLFLAIELPEPVRQHLADVGAAIRRRLDGEKVPAVSWTRQSNLHVTLKFLGEVPEAQVSGIVDALRATNVAGPALPLFTHRIKAFPSSNAARVVVARVLGDRDRLVELHRVIEERCAAIGFAKENRRYQPHVTLGRPREPLRGVWDALEKATIDLFPGPEFVAESFSLVQSKLNPAGAVYSGVAKFGLLA